jgi:hypothetical protein
MYVPNNSELCALHELWFTNVGSEILCSFWWNSNIAYGNIAVGTLCMGKVPRPVVISFSWFYALFVWSQPNTCKNNPKCGLILCFLKLKLIPDFYCIFLPMTVESYPFFVFTWCLIETPSLFCCCSGLANHRLRQTFTLDMAICVGMKLIVHGFCTEVLVKKQNGKHLW